MGNLFDLRDQQSKQRTHPLRDNNVVVVDPDSGQVYDPRQGYTAGDLPNTNMMVVPRTTWYVLEEVEEFLPNGTVVRRVIDMPPREQLLIYQRRPSKQEPPTQPKPETDRRR